MAYPGERPILSGGRRVTGWQPYKGNIFMCDLPGSKGGHWRFRRLFADGKLQTRARWPNFDPRNPLDGGWARIEAPATPESQIAFRYEPGTFPRHWAKPAEGEVNVFFGIDNDWGNDVIPIKSIDEQRRVITLVHPTRDYDHSFWSYNVPFHAGARFVVENLLEELDQPGEWCLDGEEGKLYYWPPSGDRPDFRGHRGEAVVGENGTVPFEARKGLEVVAPALDRLMALHRTKFVTIRGFTFTETTDGDNLHPDAVEGLGPLFSLEGRKYCGEALHINRAEQCVVEDNYFDSVGGNAIYLQGYNLRNVVRRNEIAHAGANGICLGGTWGHGDFLKPDATLAGPGRLSLWGVHLQYPLFNRIVDNRIHHIGEINYDAAGVFAALSEDNVIAHNAISDTSHHGINLGSGGLNHNYVEWNDIRRTCQRTGDAGAINCWGMEGPTPAYFAGRNAALEGHVIRWNFIADGHGEGIYLDSYASNCLVYGNVIVRVSGKGIKIHGGKNNILENNVIVGADYGVEFTDAVSDFIPEMAGFCRGNRFCRNIVVDCRVHMFVLDNWNDAMLERSDENVIFRSRHGPFYAAACRRLGFEANSIRGDPMFVDPAHDDYRLKPGSPAFELGFQPIDFSRIGPRK